MLEMLICLMMIASLSLLVLSFHGYQVPEHYYFLNDLMLSQSEALLQRREQTFQNGIRYNSMGHIDMARTLEFGKQKITLNLGSGYALVK